MSQIDEGNVNARNVILISQVKSEPTISYCGPLFIAKARGQNSKRQLEQTDKIEQILLWY